MATRSPERAQFLTEVLVTAIEGGIGYWSYAYAYEWFFPELAGGTARPSPGGAANAYADVVEREEERATALPLPLDVIARALTTIQRRCPHGMSEHVRRTVRYCDRMNSAAPDQAPAGIVDIDADLADQIVQVGLFDEVRYG